MNYAEFQIKNAEVAVMREIKFRAWSINSKRMYSWEQMLEVHNKFYTYFVWPDMYKLMQYTGLHDKNGKEIYEGDIIKWVDGDTLLVHYSDIHSRFMVGEISMTKGDAMGSEVIGNIYENPDLLEKGD